MSRRHHTQSAINASIIPQPHITTPLYTKMRSMGTDDLAAIAGSNFSSLCDGCIEQQENQQGHMYCSFACLQDTADLDEEELAELHAEQQTALDYAVEILAGRRHRLTPGPVHVLHTPGSLLSAATDAVAAHADAIHGDLAGMGLSAREKIKARATLATMTGPAAQQDVRNALWYHGHPRYEQTPYEVAHRMFHVHAGGDPAAGGLDYRNDHPANRPKRDGGSRKRKRTRGSRNNTRRRRGAQTRRPKAKGRGSKQRNTTRRQAKKRRR
jgi:hypothetical protein